MNSPGSPIPQLEHLSDRELLILLVHEINSIKLELILQHSRVRSLESWRYMLSGGMIVLAAMAAWILSKLP